MEPWSMAEVRVFVNLKTEILDPQGRAVLAAIKRFGLEDLVDVRQGKQFTLIFENNLSQQAISQLEKIAESLLSNPVIEDYTIEEIK